jgi:hypothetical protein
MTQDTGIQFERSVAEAIEQLDYKVTTEPLHRPEYSTWQGRISSWLAKPSHPLPGPDMAVVHGGKVVLVEAKSYPILLGPVIQARHYADYFGAQAIICVPDDAFQQIPDSVREWAEANSIVLSPFGEIGDKLKMLL